MHSLTNMSRITGRWVVCAQKDAVAVPFAAANLGPNLYTTPPHLLPQRQSACSPKYCDIAGAPLLVLAPACELWPCRMEGCQTRPNMQPSRPRRSSRCQSPTAVVSKSTHRPTHVTCTHLARRQKITLGSTHPRQRTDENKQSH
jgi:hypothetical protein